MSELHILREPGGIKPRGSKGPPNPRPIPKPRPKNTLPINPPLDDPYDWIVTTPPAATPDDASAHAAQPTDSPAG